MKKQRPLLIIVICMFLLESIFLIYCTYAFAKKDHDKYEPDEAIFTNSQDIDASYGAIAAR